MSTFKKPQDVSPIRVTNNNDNDIMYLLNLEVYKRFKDDEINIRRQVDEHERQYQDCLYQYNIAYAKYVKLLKLARTRYALEQNNHLANKSLEEIKENISRIQKTMNRHVIEKLDDNTLTQLRSHFSSQQAHTNLKSIQHDLVKNAELVKAIQSSQENIENQLDTAVLQGLDAFVDEFKL